MDTLDFSKLRWALGIFFALLLWPAINFAQTAITYSGDAVAAKGLIGGTAFEIDHLNLPGIGGSFTFTAPSPKPLPSGASCLNCRDTEKTFLSVQGSSLSSLTETDVDSVVLVIGGHTIQVGTLFNTTSAMCPTALGDPAGANWVTYVGSVTIDETFTSTTAFPGGIVDAQTFPIGTDGTVRVNRVASLSQIAAGADVVVNSIQIDMATGDQVVIGSSHAGVMCTAAPGGATGETPGGATGGAPGGATGGTPGGAPGGATGGTPGGAPGGAAGGCPGKVTGGGVFMLGGTRQTFGFVAGTKKDGTAFGNFNYVNHGTGAHLQGSVQRVSIESKTATITGALKTGDPYTVVVVDNGEPGRADTFKLTSTPLTTGGPIALDPRGGNIQFHKGCGKK